MTAQTMSGLGSEEAVARLLASGPNELPRAHRPSLAARFVRELREPMAVLLLLAATISGVAIGEVLDASAIVTIVVINVVIALFQEGRAEHALEALEELEAPTAMVIRDGHRQVVAARVLVPDDVVVVHAGDRVPADLVIIEGENLVVDEALLTGESVPVHKRVDGGTGPAVPITDRDGAVHAGTLVVAGSGLGRVQATGPDTAIGSIARRLQEIPREPTPLQEQLARLTRLLGIAAIVVATVVFALMVVVQKEVSLDEAFLTAVALAVAAVPESLAAVTTVALALGVGRMAKRGAIVRRLAAVETLGATDVLVIDKTGTVTENRMRVATIVAPDGTAHDPDDVPAWLHERIASLVILCSDATLRPPTGDPMERALLEVAGALDIENVRASSPRLASAPFTSERKRMVTVHDVAGQFELLVKGAPDVLLPWVTARLSDTGPVDMSGGHRDRLTTLTEDFAARGQRVLALASRPLHAVPDNVSDVEHDLTLVALIALRDPPRESAAASVSTVRAAGIRLLMATGDHPATAMAIGAEVGIGHGSTMSGPEMNADGLPADPTSVSVYARVDPDQKLALVTRLQELGHTVAMTGDGVNDAPALRRADIGVALGGSGSDVAREAADLVITDDDLATIVAAVREGRGIWNNLRKVVDYLVPSNLAEVLVVIGALVLVPQFGVPLLPLQLLWINLLTDGLPALALAVDPVRPDVMDQPPRRRESRLLDAPHLRRLAPQALVLAAGGLASLLIARNALHLDTEAARTVLFTTMVVAQVFFAFVVRQEGKAHLPPNHWLRLSVIVALVLHVLIVTFAPAQVVFHTVMPPWQGWVLIGVAGLLPVLLLAVAKRRWSSFYRA